jgi:hypothetical protein
MIDVEDLLMFGTVDVMFGESIVAAFPYFKASNMVTECRKKINI